MLQVHHRFLHRESRLTAQHAWRFSCVVAQGLHDGMHRVVLQLSTRASASVFHLRAMSQLRKRKSIASADLDAHTQGDPASGSQGPPTPAQVEAAPVSLRRSRRAAVSAALRLAEVADGPLAAVGTHHDVAADSDTVVTLTHARRGKKQPVPVDDASADGAAEGALMPAASVVVAAPVRRRSSKKLAKAAASEIALGVEPDPAAEAEVAIVIPRKRGKKAAASAAEAPVGDSRTAQDGAAADVKPAKPPRAPRRKKAAAAVSAPSDSEALVDAPQLPALTVERMPAAIAHLAAADPGAASCPALVPVVTNLLASQHSCHGKASRVQNTRNICPTRPAFGRIRHELMRSAFRPLV